MSGLTFRLTIMMILFLLMVSPSPGSDDLFVIPVPMSEKCRHPGTFVNFLGMSFVYVPPGTFMMGSPESELERDYDETLHQVRLTKGFYMQTTEVTQGQWKAIMAGDNPSHFNTCGDDCAVDSVSWYDVQDFIFRLNFWSAALGEGTPYRLPTEAEWEYAARAGSTTAFANGEIIQTYCLLDPNLDLMGWYCGNSEDTTHPVARKHPNAWGLYDMHGNVWEWVQDWWDPDYGLDPVGPVTDPTGGSGGGFRVYRGGCWNCYAAECRVAERNYNMPGDRFYTRGVRLVRSLP